VEAARALAQRTLREGGKDANSRIVYAFRLATSRKPTKPELGLLRSLLDNQILHYRSEKDAADELVRVGESKSDEKIDDRELAAWTVVMSAILNLDETITKE
jgi:hypothetical protein